MRRTLTFTLALTLLLLASCQPAAGGTTPEATESLPPTGTHLSPTESPIPPTTQPSLTASETASPSPEPLQVRFAVIGDYGLAGAAEAEVSDLVHAWEPDLILTVGDNNYPSGSAETIDENIGQYYHDFIYPYYGTFGEGAEENRFFPSLGNHEFYTDEGKPYFDYFTLPGNERYYDFIWGPVHFFAVNSDEHEPDGVRSSSVQATWLQENLAVSASAWQVVFLHHAPYSSASFHGSTTWLRWDFGAWGADAVLAGHDHTYERLLVGEIPYFVVGTGGGALYGFGPPLPETQKQYNADHGAMLVTASETEMLFEFYNRAGELIDLYQVGK